MRRLRLVSRAFISISSIFGTALKELKKKIYIYYSIFLQKEAITQTYKTYKARQSPSYLLRKTAWEGLVSYSNKRTRKKNAFISTTKTFHYPFQYQKVWHVFEARRKWGTKGEGEEKGSIDSFWSFSSSHTGGCSPSNVCRPALSTDFPASGGRIFIFSKEANTPEHPSPSPAVTSFCPRHRWNSGDTRSTQHFCPLLQNASSSRVEKRGLTLDEERFSSDLPPFNGKFLTSSDIRSCIL